jgi:hypothetical protein
MMNLRHVNEPVGQVTTPAVASYFQALRISNSIFHQSIDTLKDIPSRARHDRMNDLKGKLVTIAR